FQLSNDFHIKRLAKNYLPEDQASHEHAALLEWVNIYYQKPSSSIRTEKSVVRMGLVQWQMRPYKTFEDLTEQIEYFVDSVSGYEADFILFPEYINAPLMAEFNHLSEADAIRQLATYTDRMRDVFAEFAISYNINIITGSMPEVRDESLYNVGHLCKRNGEIEKYEKIHATPDEIKVWGMSGGNRIQVFDTDAGKVGVLICYDVEFPELSRLLADQDMDILFVPFMTDTQNGYSRVRNCAMARAIENECYVAVAGSVGNLPRVHNMDIQYGQSVVFTPCDFAFPTNGIKAEATPNTEMMLIVDVDLDLLKELHLKGSVRTLKDRRKDLYDVVLKQK
ncbi:MAG: carbon-nitrogen hydrolase family protein, partial [Balneolaceae bacterium]